MGTARLTAAVTRNALLARLCPSYGEGAPACLAERSTSGGRAVWARSSGVCARARATREAFAVERGAARLA